MNTFKKAQNLLAGKKTYIVGALMLLISLEKYISGDITLTNFLTTVQGLLGFTGVLGMAFRAAIAKTTK